MRWALPRCGSAAIIDAPQPLAATPPAAGPSASRPTRTLHFPDMTDGELLDEVRRMRGDGLPPKAIARALGVRPAEIAPLVRQVAAERPEVPIEQGALAGCWVSPAWSHELIVERRDGWEDVELGPDGPAGLALVLLARAGRGDRVSVCGYLVDTFCLGVKDVIGPEPMRRRQLLEFVRTYFVAFPAPPLRAPIGLARHLVHGAVTFAAGLGFEPHPDFAAAREHLGELDEPCAITFGRHGVPLYVQGIHEDPMTIVHTLERTVGTGRFAVAA